MECILQRMDNPVPEPQCEQTNVILESGEVIHEGVTGQVGITEDLVIEGPEPAHDRVLAIETDNLPAVSNEKTDAVSFIEFILHFWTHSAST
jgi:hypothetical protein